MILDGKSLRDKILEEIKERIEREKLEIKLAIIEAGDNEANKIYIKQKVNACNKVGIEPLQFILPEETSEEEIIALIEDLNNDDTVTGIILQSPIPKGLDFDKCCGYIKASKDVDGFTKENVYKLYLNSDPILPCTVKGIIRMLDEYNINLDGANALIVGRGNIVGKPLALAMENRNATVTLAHSHTKNLEELTKSADIVVAATGVPRMISGEMVKQGATVIDVGVSRIEGHIVGDIDFESVSKVAGAVTPNPGGVGPMTVAMIIDNLIEMDARNKKIKRTRK